jgi:hypothetical protein
MDLYYYFYLLAVFILIILVKFDGKTNTNFNNLDQRNDRFKNKRIYRKKNGIKPNNIKLLDDKLKKSL